MSSSGGGAERLPGIRGWGRVCFSFVLAARRSRQGWVAELHAKFAYRRVEQLHGAQGGWIHPGSQGLLARAAIGVKHWQMRQTDTGQAGGGKDAVRKFGNVGVGATPWQVFWKIALPLSKPLMATIALFLTFGYWNDWFQSSLYISDTKLYSLQALLDHVQRNIEMMANNPSLGVTTAQYMNSMPKEGARMAMAIIIIIPIACCYPFFQKYFISGLTVGAVKG